MKPSHKIANAIAFQAGWFVCIVMGSISSVIYLVAFILFYWWQLSKQTTPVNRHKECSWLVIFLVFGLMVETAHFSLNALVNTAAVTANTHALNSVVHLQFPPVWLIALWVMFGMAMRISLSFMFTKPTLASLLIIIFIPLNYWAGANLSSTVDLGNPVIQSLTLITLFWLLFFFAALKIQRHSFEHIIND